MKLEFALPKGYRWLRVGEVKRNGDWFPSLLDEKWSPVDVGYRVHKQKFYIRRKARGAK